MSQPEYFEYSSAANINLPTVPIRTWTVQRNVEMTKEENLDLSKELKTEYCTTSPNVRASFIYIKNGDSISLNRNATSSVFYVVEGTGNYNNITWKDGDIFTIPYDKIILEANTDCILYSICDEPLLYYLGVVPNRKIFEAVLYTQKEIEKNMQLLTDPNAEKNRQGVLLGNTSTTNSTKTITPTLWSLYNKLPAHTFQKPHRHNSVAIDYCIDAHENVYTLIGDELNEDGSIKNPKRVDWKTKSVFTTPPGLWHSHHNDGDKDAYVLPLQDAGLYTYQRTLDIQFVE